MASLLGLWKAGRDSSRSKGPEFAFWTSRTQRRIGFIIFPLLLIVWAILVFGLKAEINPFGDELGYHEGSAFLARSIGRGTFLADALDDRVFKYPGYFALGGVIYSIFGEQSVLFRAAGLIPFVVLVLVIPNIAALVAGERARVFAFVTTMTSPTFLFFSVQLLRDIYITAAIAIVVHSLVVYAVNGRQMKPFYSPIFLSAFALIYFMRSPQAVLTLTLAIVSIIAIRSVSLPARQRKYSYAVILLLVGLSAFFLRSNLLDVVSRTYFEGIERDVSVSQLSALSEFSFSDADGMVSALIDPKFVVITSIAKLSSFVLGPHPFAVVDDGSNLLLDLVGDFSQLRAGGYAWEDVFLVYGLQWIQNLGLMVFLLSGALALWKCNRSVFVAFLVFWVSYSAITIFSGNETRWGLPLMIIFYVVPAVGYAWFGAKLRQYAVVAVGTFLGVVAVRTAGIPIPMLCVPLAVLGIMILARLVEQSLMLEGFGSGFHSVDLQKKGIH